MRLALIFIVGVALGVGQAAAIETDGPARWSEGDHWTIRGERLEGTTRFTFEQTTRVIGPAEARVGRQVFDTWELDVRAVSALNGSGGRISTDYVTHTNGTHWVRTTDHALVRVVSDTVTDSKASGPSTQHSEISFAKPCPPLDYPLAVGKRWEVACTSHVTTGATTQDQEQARAIEVLRRENVTVPAGTFDTFVIEQVTTTGSTDATTLLWLAPEACLPVKSADRDGAGIAVELVVFACAGAGEPEPTAGQIAGRSTPGLSFAAALMTSALAAALHAAYRNSSDEVRGRGNA